MAEASKILEKDEPKQEASSSDQSSTEWFTKVTPTVSGRQQMSVEGVALQQPVEQSPEAQVVQHENTKAQNQATASQGVALQQPVEQNPEAQVVQHENTKAQNQATASQGSSAVVYGDRCQVNFNGPVIINQGPGQTSKGSATYLSTGGGAEIDLNVNAVLANEAQEESTQPSVGIINQQPSDAKMSHAVLRESLPGYEKWLTLVITYSFPAGSLTGVSYEAQEFTEYLPLRDIGRKCYYLLKQAFNAGSLFKIQVVSTGRGQIIRDDNFPCKTNKRGGPENNGYPDENHAERLKAALEDMGFE